MRIRGEDSHKTAIRTCFSAFKWRVLCFDFKNSSAALCRLLTSLLRELNGECLLLTLDDFFVYSGSVDEHNEHLIKLFGLLRKHQLYVRLNKCLVYVQEVEFLR